MKKLLLTLILLFAPLLSATTSYYADRAVGVSPFGAILGLVPIQYGQVRVCDLPLTQISPCLPLSSITGVPGFPVDTSGNKFGQVTTLVTGQFAFGCSAGTNMQIQVAPQSSNTPMLSYPASCGGVLNALPFHNLLSITHPDTVPKSPPDVGDLIYGSPVGNPPTGIWSTLAIGTHYEALQVGAKVLGKSSPEWGPIHLDQSAAVTGILPVPNGGTGAGTLTIHGVLIGQTQAPVHITAAGNATECLTSNGAGADPTFQLCPGASGFFPFGGDGSDGAVVANGSSTVACLGAPSSSIYTMSQDCFFTTLTINSGVTVKVNYSRVYASVSATINGTLKADASAGDKSLPDPITGSTGGVGGSGANNPGQPSDKSLPALTPGSNNSGNTGQNGTVGDPGTAATGVNESGAGTVGAEATCGSLTQFNPPGNANPSGDGGSSGVTSGGIHGAAGANGAAFPTLQYPKEPLTAMSGNTGRPANPNYGGCAWYGGAGSAGAGAGDGVNFGGGGGAGGGSGSSGQWLVLSSPTITVGATGVITANGGNGGDGSGGAGKTSCAGGENTGGGGGGTGGNGGPGGVAVLVYHDLINGGTISATGGIGGANGLGGAGCGTGAAGTNGGVGKTGVGGLLVSLKM